MDLLKAGLYKAKIADYGVGKTKKGDPRPTIIFEVESNGSKRNVYWAGSFNGGGFDITLDALTTCGLKNPQNFMYLADGKKSGALNVEAIYEVNVSENPAEGDVKAHNKVEWIRLDGASKFKNAITVQEFASLIQQQELHARFLDYAQRKGIALNTSSSRNAADIPF